MEQLLIDRGADIHLLTTLGRNILHAAVVTRDAPERLDSKRASADPIEIVSDICSLEGASSSASINCSFVAAVLSQGLSDLVSCLAVLHFVTDTHTQTDTDTDRHRHRQTQTHTDTHRHRHTQDTPTPPFLSQKQNNAALDLDVPDKFGRTPLHYASVYGAILTARYLIKRGADPNREDGDKNTALQLALIGHQVNYAALLLDHIKDIKHPILFTSMEYDEKTKERVEKRHTTSTFRFLASHHFTGLACVFIDHGVDVRSAFADCVSVHEYQMALTLLRKTPSARVKALKGEDGNTLVTYVCQHVTSSSAFHKLSVHAACPGASPATAITEPFTSDARGGILGERSSRAFHPCQPPPARTPKARPWSSALLR